MSNWANEDSGLNGGSFFKQRILQSQLLHTILDHLTYFTIFSFRLLHILARFKIYARTLSLHVCAANMLHLLLFHLLSFSSFPFLYSFKITLKHKFTYSQAACLGIKFLCGSMTRKFICLDIFLFFIIGSPSVVRQILSGVSIFQYLHIIYRLKWFKY